MITLVWSEKCDSYLPGPEHHIRPPGKKHSKEEKAARNPFPFLKLDIVSSHDMGQQRLNFTGRKESSGTVNEQ